MDVEQLWFPATADLPNSPLPLLLWRGAFASCALDTASGAVERVLAARGWRAPWRGVVYAYPHYHPNGHELLVCTRGGATVRFGGAAQVVDVGAGDVVLIPAGVGHEGVAEREGFECVGAYPDAQEAVEVWAASEARCAEGAARALRVAIPPSSPVEDSECLAEWLPQCRLK